MSLEELDAEIHGFVARVVASPFTLEPDEKAGAGGFPDGVWTPKLLGAALEGLIAKHEAAASVTPDEARIMRGLIEDEVRRLERELAAQLGAEKPS